MCTAWAPVGVGGANGDPTLLVAGLAVVVAAGLGLATVLRARSRKAGAPDARPAPILPEVTVLDHPGDLRPSSPSSPTLSADDSPRVCPTCRDEHPPEARFCPSDGNRLISTASPDARAPAGSVCPLCSRGYDPGVTSCTRDGEELVPFSVLRAQRDSAPGTTMCGTCGARYEGGQRFCVADGSELGAMN